MFTRVHEASRNSWLGVFSRVRSGILSQDLGQQSMRDHRAGLELLEVKDQILGQWGFVAASTEPSGEFSFTTSSGPKFRINRGGLNSAILVRRFARGTEAQCFTIQARIAGAGGAIGMLQFRASSIAERNRWLTAFDANGWMLLDFDGGDARTLIDGSDSRAGRSPYGSPSSRHGAPRRSPYSSPSSHEGVDLTAAVTVDDMAAAIFPEAHRRARWQRGDLSPSAPPSASSPGASARRPGSPEVVALQTKLGAAEEKLKLFAAMQNKLIATEYRDEQLTAELRRLQLASASASPVPSLASSPAPSPYASPLGAAAPPTPPSAASGSPLAPRSPYRAESPAVGDATLLDSALRLDVAKLAVERAAMTADMHGMHMRVESARAELSALREEIVASREERVALREEREREAEARFAEAQRAAAAEAASVAAQSAAMRAEGAAAAETRRAAAAAVAAEEAAAASRAVAIAIEKEDAEAAAVAAIEESNAALGRILDGVYGNGGAAASLNAGSDGAAAGDESSASGERTAGSAAHDKEMKDAAIVAALDNQHSRLRAKWQRAKVLGHSAAAIAALKHAENTMGYHAQGASHQDDDEPLPHHVAFSVLFDEMNEMSEPVVVASLVGKATASPFEALIDSEGTSIAGAVALPLVEAEAAAAATVEVEEVHEFIRSRSPELAGSLSFEHRVASGGGAADAAASAAPVVRVWKSKVDKKSGRTYYVVRARMPTLATATAARTLLTALLSLSLSLSLSRSLSFSLSLFLYIPQQNKKTKETTWTAPDPDLLLPSMVIGGINPTVKAAAKVLKKKKKKKKKKVLKRKKKVSAAAAAASSSDDDDTTAAMRPLAKRKKKTVLKKKRRASPKKPSSRASSGGAIKKRTSASPKKDKKKSPKKKSPKKLPSKKASLVPSDEVAVEVKTNGPTQRKVVKKKKKKKKKTTKKKVASKRKALVSRDSFHDSMKL